MATKTAGRPRGVTDLATYRTVIMRETGATLLRCGGNRPPRFAIPQQCLRVSGFRIVVRREGIDRVNGLRNFPTHVRRHRRLLPKLGSLPTEPRTEWRVASVQQIDLASVTARDQCRALVDGAVTIDAGNRSRIARFPVKHSVAVHIDVEMAITALHGN